MEAQHQEHKNLCLIMLKAEEIIYYFSNPKVRGDYFVKTINGYKWLGLYLILPLTLIGLTILICFLWGRSVLIDQRDTIYRVKDPKGIEILEPINIGGVDQWLHIRGRNRDNPILLYLHGGPGSANIGGADGIQRPWEDYVTVVQWDQRHTGKSYYPIEQAKETVTLERMLQDTEEVIEHLLQRFNREKIIILGHSWGSYLGMQMVSRHPEWVYAYIGVGQVVNKMEANRVMFERVLQYAQKENDIAVMERLETIRPYYLDTTPDKVIEDYRKQKDHSFVSDATFLRKKLSDYAGEALIHHLGWDEVLGLSTAGPLFSPHYDLSENISRRFNNDKLFFNEYYNFLLEYLRTDLRKETGVNFKVPVFFFTGKYDWHVPRSLTESWFNDITAPYKELVWFEESSHVPTVEEPGKFLVALVTKVLPFTKIQKKPNELDITSTHKMTFDRNTLETAPKPTSDN